MSELGSRHKYVAGLSGDERGCLMLKSALIAIRAFYTFFLNSDIIVIKAISLFCLVLLITGCKDKEAHVSTVYREPIFFDELDKACKNTLKGGILADIPVNASTVDMYESQNRWLACQGGHMNMIFDKTLKVIQDSYFCEEHHNEYQCNELQSMADDLRNAQQLWNESMLLTCDVQSKAYLGGTMRGIVFGNCKANNTASRIDALSDMYSSLSHH
jgi:uncharacterized protein YecT (DUF1311 family)